MNDHNEKLWQTKLHARLHDPAEKALVLMRDPGTPHDEGSARVLREAVFGTPNHPGAPIRDLVKRADWWASSADRASFPSDGSDGRYPDWQQVRFAEKPVFVHSISGAEYDIRQYAGKLTEISVAEIRAVSEHHFKALIQFRSEAPDVEKTLLAFWRFGPELDNDQLKTLWSLLPADTRTPDHSIWQHLDLTSAFAGAFAADADGEAALLSLTFGPVQEFIAAGRSTSDLWAGSHFLSRLAWEGLKIICNELGPDAVLFPQLRGVPQVDAWLLKDKGLKPELFADAEWRRQRTDANPLFVAALPNKFVAVVPASGVEDLAGRVRDAMRRFAMDKGKQALKRVLKEAIQADARAPFEADDASLPCFGQLEAQLGRFPEVHWSVAPFSLARASQPDRADGSRLKPLLAHFHQSADAPGFLGSDAWKAFRALSKSEREKTGLWFWEPRPGALYPALYDLLDRSLSANKSLRRFDGSRHEGYRCSLAADVEWLTTDRKQLGWTRNQCKTNGTLWTRLAKEHPSWCKSGEHLGALAMLKRLWPTLFVEEIQEITQLDGIQRFVVSSHALALSPSIDRWLDDPTGLDSDAAKDVLEKAEPSALPGKIAREHLGGRAFDIARRIPDYLDGARDAGDDERKRRERHIKTLLGARPETYYGLILMDGDQMGKWLSGELAPPYDALFHPQIRAALDSRFAGQNELEAYRKASRAPSPAYHGAISSALNAFALDMAQRVTEHAHKGKLLYAGGDDLMALCASDDLPDLMVALRAAYSGSEYQHREQSRIGQCGGGHALVRGRLVRLMGDRATASMGAVIAHQMAPLAAALRELRGAEARAKSEGARDAFSLSVVKHSGGTQRLTAKWRYGDVDTMQLLDELRQFLSRDEVSRRAVYNAMEWTRDLPEPENGGEMLEKMLAFQLARQSQGDDAEKRAPVLARRLVRLTLAESERKRQASKEDRGKPRFSSLEFLRTFLSVAEFLAREQRTNHGDAA